MRIVSSFVHGPGGVKGSSNGHFRNKALPSPHWPLEQRISEDHPFNETCGIFPGVAGVGREGVLPAASSIWASLWLNTLPCATTQAKSCGSSHLPWSAPVEGPAVRPKERAARGGLQSLPGKPQRVSA
jgi:hypothetical protein